MWYFVSRPFIQCRHTSYITHTNDTDSRNSQHCSLRHSRSYFHYFTCFWANKRAYFDPKNCKTCWSWWCELLRLIDSQMWVDNANIQSVFLKFGQGNTRPKKNVNENLIHVWNIFFLPKIKQIKQLTWEQKLPNLQQLKLPYGYIYSKVK